MMNNDCNHLSDWIALHSTTHNHLYAVLSGSATSDALTYYGQLDGTCSPEGIWLNTPYQQWYDMMPYIVELSPNSPFLTWINDTTTSNWGWLAFSPFSQQELVAQLKLLTKVKLPDNKEVFFRYWDGHFLAQILAASTNTQKQALLPGLSTLWTNNQVIHFPEPITINNDIIQTLAPEQLSLLADEKQKELRQELKTYLKQKFPKKMRTLGAKYSEQFLNLMMDKIAQYQIPRKDQAKQFLDLAIVLGTHFDTDPMLSRWVKPRLLTVATNTISLIELNDDLSIPFKIAMGENLSTYLTRLQQLLQKPTHSLFEIENEEQVIQFVQDLYPERNQQLAFDTLERFYQQQIPYYQSQLFFDYSSHAVLLAMQFFLGHRIFEDPLYPWASTLMIKNGLLPEKECVERMVTYAKKRVRKEIIMVNNHLRKNNVCS
ncbi:DUF4123 domain-containing protein [Gilliamella intestini]|uniref:DUF4123 domain-containing protein n=1 Tax=Gilliamella intestini TaxID=1798183 RepID=A0A1C4CZF4_9GAMM|nr:DUF4123 domain-containing protein [Gilliamella intestini]SCC24473.1 protein of unknown function [Gilliamella intestini]